LTTGHVRDQLFACGTLGFAYLDDGRLAWRITDSDGLYRPIRCYDYDVFGALRRVRLGSTTVNDPANPCSDAALNMERSIAYSIDGAGRRVGRVERATVRVRFGACGYDAEMVRWVPQVAAGFGSRGLPMEAGITLRFMTCR
jgi:hypothetical protein